VMVLGLLWGKEEAAFLGSARNGLSHQVIGTPGSNALVARSRSASASSFHQPVSASTRAGNVLCVLALLAGVCGAHRVAAFRSASQHKLRSCNLVCQAVALPVPMRVQARATVVEELKPTGIAPATAFPATTDDPQVLLPPMAAHTTKPQITACRAAMVAGARCIRARSVARRARTASRSAASRAARRAVGSRLQAASCPQDATPMPFDASRLRLKIQTGLRLASRVCSRGRSEMRLSAGSAAELNGEKTPALYVIRDYRFKDLYMCNCACCGE